MDLKKRISQNVSALLLLGMTAFVAVLFYFANRAMAVTDRVQAEKIQIQNELNAR